MAEDEPTGGGTFLTRKYGPLPMWAWMGIALGALLAITTWRKNKQDASTQDTATTLPDDLQPMYTFVDADTTLVTQNTTVSGRTQPPRGPIYRAPEKPIPTPTTPTPTTPTPTTPTAPAGKWVTIVKYAQGQPEGTPSTLWGVAKSVYGSGNLWRKIWDAPQNSALKTKHGGNERLIQPGEKYFVPT